jgi:2-C-methyl-D-erythritol 4-phosphate cytidylyltransferase/2-C-methyl-D-erythritol 4-phosphate cytidylyltransferase/2-C-methyl-D-erythritol 2,4-cyclodiphosphate synthase
MGGVKKEYQKLSKSGSLTVLGSAVSAFAAVSSVSLIVIAVPENGEAAAREALPPDLTAQSPKIVFVSGGKTRRASVYSALSFLSAHHPRYVLIHDGARPWISPSLVEQVIAAVKTHNAVIPLLPLTDTPKECDAPLWELRGQSPSETDFPPVFIKRHLKRANAGIAQTPQGFAFAELLKAHEIAAAVDHKDFTDDAEIWGMFCGPVAVIPGSRENRKITFPEDLN